MWGKTARWFAGLYLAWLGLVVLLVWPLLNYLPGQLVRTQLQRDFRAELILFNPFTLSLEVRGAELREGDGHPILSVESLRANLALASLWRGALWLQEIIIRSPVLQVVVRPDGAVNLLEMLPDSAASAEPTGGQLFPLHLQLLHLDGGELRVEDQTVEGPWRTGLRALSLQALDISTLPDVPGHYTLSLEASEGGRLQGEGRLSIDAGEVDGRLGLAALQLAPGVRRAAPLLPFAPQAGTLDLAAGFQLNWADGLRGAIHDGNLTLRNLAALPRDADDYPDTHLRLATLQLSGLSADLAAQTVQARSLRLEGLDVAGWQDEESISLLALLPPARDSSADPGLPTESTALTTPGTDEAAPASPWRVALEQFSLTDSRAYWRSPFTAPALSVNALEARGGRLHWPPDGTSPLELALEINQQARFTVTGDVHLGEGSGNLDMTLQSLPLAWFAPNLPARLRAEIGSGSLSTRVSATLAGFQPDKLHSDGSIDRFSILLRGAEDELTHWEKLAWRNVQIALPERRVEVDGLSLDGFSGRLHIDPQGRINVSRVLAADAADTTPDTGTAAAAGAAPATREDASDPAETLGEPAATTDWQVAVPSIEVNDSALDFMDESLPIRFRTVIGDLEGSISGFRLDPDARLEIDLTGAVDGYAPVTLQGHALPLRSPPDLQLALNFRGIDMARLTPYSGTYAGYAIERGTLTVDLDYRLEDRRLQGRNKVVISQLRLGERIDSERALDLPLRLGLALLTDSRGIIDLDVPVRGDLDNPQFSLGSVIAGAFVNLLRQAVTAPFRLLASLVGSEADLRQVDFAAGSTDIDEHGTGKLRELAEALQQRPALDLILTGQTSPVADARRLRELQLRATLVAEGLTEEDIDSRSEAWAATVAERHAALQAASDQTASQPGPEPRKLSNLARYRALRDAETLPETALRDLASERAASIKRFLVNEAQIAPERITIDAPASGGEGASAVVMEVAT